MDLSAYLNEHSVSVDAFARRIKASPVTVYKWLARERRPSPAFFHAIERETDGKVTRHDLRPDLYDGEAA